MKAVNEEKDRKTVSATNDKNVMRQTAEEGESPSQLDGDQETSGSRSQHQPGTPESRQHGRQLPAEGQETRDK